MMMKKTATILLVSTLALTFTGCGGNLSASSDSSSNGPVTEIDAGTTTGMADMPVAGITADLSFETEKPVATADAAQSYSSIPDDSFLYKGNVISVLNDTETTLDALEASNTTPGSLYQDEKLYSLDSGAIEFETYHVDGKEQPKCIYIIEKGILTPKNICVGCSIDELVDAYGEPDKIHDETYDAYEYNYGDVDLVFDLNMSEKKIDRICIENTETVSKVNQEPH